MKNDPKCTLCKLHQGAESVCLLGTGPKQSDIMIIGDTPSHHQDKRGQTIASKELITLLDRNDIDLGDVYLCHAVSCFPGDKKPGKREIAACKKWLDYQIKQIKPKFVMLMGATAYYAIVGESGIKKKRGKPFEKEGIVYMPTFDPRATLWDPRASYHVEKDFAFFREIIAHGGIPREEGLDYVLIETRKQFDQMLRDLRGVISLDIETSCLYPWGEWKINKKTKEQVEFVSPRVVTLGFGTKTKQYIFPLEHPDTPDWVTHNLADLLDEIEECLEECIISAHNGKFDFLWMWVRFGIKWYQLFDFDTMLAHYVLDENSLHDLEYLAKKYFGAHEYDVPLEVKQGKHGLPKCAHYQAHDLLYTRGLYFKLKKELHRDGEVQRVFQKILMPCSRLFTEIEYDGVCIDTSRMDEAEKYLRGEYARTHKNLNKWGEINWGSPQQLAKLLFTKGKVEVSDGHFVKGLGLEVVERTAKGAPSTSESVIKRLDHPLAADLLAFRGAKQQLSFFIDGWKPYLTKSGGAFFLHPSFKLHGTVTGRLSCEHPNLQQVPRDKRIRQLITAPPGYTLVEADLSQIELRVAAELAQEPTMLDAFRRGIDVHWLTATRELQRGGGGKHAQTIIRTAEAYLKRGGKPKKLRFSEAMHIVIEKISPSVAEELQNEWGEKDPEMLWKEIRKKAKAVNFGYLYGMWWKKFKLYARDNYGVKLSDHEAEESRKFFFATFPVFEDWHKRQRRYARMNGYVRSLSGRKRRLPSAQLAEDVPERREAERQAINSPVQSFANEINLMAAIQLRKEFGRSIVRIVGTVHDALLVWVKSEYVENVVSRLLEIMSRPKLFEDFDIKLSVPVLAEAKVGAWGVGTDFHKWVKQNATDRQHKSRSSSARRDHERTGARYSSGSVKRHSEASEGRGETITSTKTKARA